MGWLWIVAAGWVLLAVGVALLIVRSVAIADRKAAEEKARSADAPNIVLAPPPPLRLAPQPVAAEPVATEPPAPVEPAAAESMPPRRSSREAPTIPGLPSARPPVGRPPAPQATPQVPQRRSRRA